MSGFFLIKIRSISLHCRCRSCIVFTLPPAWSVTFRLSSRLSSSSRCRTFCISNASDRSFRADCNSARKRLAHSFKCCTSIFSRSDCSSSEWLVSRRARCACDIVSCCNRKLCNRSSVSFSRSCNVSICCSSARSRVHENELDGVMDGVGDGDRTADRMLFGGSSLVGVGKSSIKSLSNGSP